MDRDNINTALLTIIAATLLLLLWRDTTIRPLSAADIALAMTDPSKCLEPTVKPALIEP